MTDDRPILLSAAIDAVETYLRPLELGISTTLRAGALARLRALPSPPLVHRYLVVRDGVVVLDGTWDRPLTNGQVAALAAGEGVEYPFPPKEADDAE